MTTAESVVREAREAEHGTFLFLSEILGRPVVDEAGAPLGRLADLKVRLGETFPRVIGLAVRPRRGRRLLELDWAEAHTLSTGTVRLHAGAEARLRPLQAGPDELFLREDLLDKQVVDTSGAKIERVNDVHLLVVGGDLRLVHVDFGARGILRRLGWLHRVDRWMQWLFAYRLGERMISWKYVQPLPSGSDRRDLKLNVAARRLHELHPSDLADIIEDLDRASQTTLFGTLDPQTAAQTLEEVADPRLQASLIESATEEKASDILGEMAPDEATDLLADLPSERKERLIRTMDQPSREAVVELLKFKEGTAGSIMTKDFLALPETATIAEAVEAFRATTHPLESVAYLYVTDAAGRLAGVSTLRHLVICERTATLGGLMNPRLVTVRPDDSVRDVADVFRKYKFLAVPVVGEDGRLQGIVTLKDIMESELGDR